MAGKLQRRRAWIALGTVLVAFTALIVPLVSYAVAQSEPNVTIINPSSYSDDGSEETPPLFIVSDAETGDDEEESPNEDTYRLTAWVANAPADALLEFELQTGLAVETLGTADRVANDVFEFHWDITQQDGPHTIRAILYEGTGVFAEEIDRHERPILLRTGRPAPQAEAPTVDIVYPTNGGPAGFYVNPLTGVTNLLIDYEYSDGTDTVYFFYTLSDPGDDPVWKQCASTTFTPDTAAANARIRCTLESVDQGGQSVTGVAAVANDDESGEGDTTFNTSGDALRILPYDQDATTIEVDRETTRVDKAANGSFACSQLQAVTVNDQLGRAIGGINVDVHAQGPSDQTRFHTANPPLLVFDPTLFMPPDKAHGTELGYVCAEPRASAQFARQQGDHNRVGVPDVKHVENAAGGTGDAGTARASLHADREGATFLTFWADEDNDDRYCSQELAVAASIGWDEPAPVPALEIPEVDVCPVPTPPPPGGVPSGEPSPSPSESPSPDPRGCTVRGTEGDDTLRGTTGDDIICGNGGEDTIFGLAGDDTIHGDAGRDSIQGGGGKDTIDGGAAVDGISGGGGRDVIDGGPSSDILIGGGGDDTVRGNGANDSLEGNRGRDVLTGGSGNDRIEAGPDSDIVKGGGGADQVTGGGGSDTIRGDKANDRLFGNGGRDTLHGGPGRDRCKGGGGRDRTKSC